MAAQDPRSLLRGGPGFEAYQRVLSGGEAWDVISQELSGEKHEYEVRIRTLLEEYARNIVCVLSEKCCITENGLRATVEVMEAAPLPGSIDAMTMPTLEKKKKMRSIPQHAVAMMEKECPQPPHCFPVEEDDRVMEKAPDFSVRSLSLPRRTTNIEGLDVAKAKLLNSSSNFWESESYLKASCMRRVLWILATHPGFEKGTAVIIIFNAVVMGLMSDSATRNLGDDSPRFYTSMRLVFTIIFALELVIRLLHEQRMFAMWSSKNFWWNMFDSAIVATAILEECMLRGGDSSYFAGASAIRLLRICKLVRVFRLLRVLRIFSTLRAMIHAAISSLTSLIWCLGLLFIITYVFGVLLLQLMTENLATSAEGSSMTTEHFDTVRDKFGTLISTMFTLIKCIMGGIDWGDVADALVDADPLLAVLLTFYVMFCVLCVLNIVTGVFVENASKLIQQDTEHMIMEELQHRDDWMYALAKVFLKGSDGEDSVNFEKFQNFVENTKVQAYFRRIGLNVESDNAKLLFEIVDRDHSGTVTVEQFIDGCSQVVGGARQLDMASMSKNIKMINKNVAEILAKTPVALA
eukprot:NODE_3084_length_2095_cov_27.282520.p1 GENE.NODE_3084_length_2095_cov_27.282520~~NODE_3084_length_2095_cov_27.282520.p1  ORF type:complete len:577 (-),score=95.45 NODE_3084_length_2095_cov_27.282520:269-1999(-)